MGTDGMVVSGVRPSYRVLALAAREEEEEEEEEEDASSTAAPATEEDQEASPYAASSYAAEEELSSYGRALELLLLSYLKVEELRGRAWGDGAVSTRHARMGCQGVTARRHDSLVGPVITPLGGRTVPAQQFDIIESAYGCVGGGGGAPMRERVSEGGL
jgi:hypothetical protein